MEVKTCSTCKRKLGVERFSKNKTHKDGLSSQCKDCVAEYDVKHWAKYYANPENKKRITEYMAKWQANPEVKKRRAEYNAEWYANPENKKRRNERRKERCLTDINFKLAKNLRTRLYNAIKGNFKSGSAVRDLGCTVDELKIYLAKQFKEGMTWENWSFEVWHVDHIIPLAVFNLEDRNQLLQAVHYSNLQPMWAKENISKSDKILECYCL